MFGSHLRSSHDLARRRKGFPAALCVVSAIALLFTPAHLAVAGDPATTQVGDSKASGATAASPEGAVAAPRIELAALQPVPDLLAGLALASTPSTTAENAARDFAEVEGVREQGRGVSAVVAYVSVIDRYPSSPQAKAADSRANFVMNQLDGSELDALEAALPAPETLKDLKSLIVLGQFHVLRARQLAETDPAAAAQHIQTVYGMAWKAFEDDLDDDYKKTILEEYLLAADTLGKGEDTRARLSAHAETLPWSFTRWLIKAEIDGVEPDPQLIPTQEGLESVRKYYLLKGRESSDPEKAKAYSTKSRDVALGLLKAQPVDSPRFDLAHVLLEASDALGPDATEEAIDYVEQYLQSQPLSIIRWIVRYELAFRLGQPEAGVQAHVKSLKHFQTLLEEAETGLVESVIRNVNIDVEVRGLLACVWGHAFAAIHRVDDANRFYDWVLLYCPRETHPGESAAYAKARMFERQHREDAEACVRVFEEFAENNPSSFYAPHALIRVAEILEKQGEPEAASALYERVTREYPHRSETNRAQMQLEVLENTARSISR